MTPPQPQHRDRRPTVSVIIPTHDSADVLHSCLQSLQAHGYPHQEVIVVDGYSRDQTPDIALKAGAQVLQASGSQARARNVGVAKATGDYVFFMDSDQTLRGDAIQECVELCSNQGVQAVKIPETFYGNTYWSACSAYWRNHVNRVGGRQGGIPRFYERERLLDAGLFNEDLTLWEDHDLYERMTATGAQTAWCRAHLYHQEPPAVSRMLAKNLRYGRSIPAFLATTPRSSTPMVRISLLTLSSVLKSWWRSPRLATGCLILTALKASAALLGVLQGLLTPASPPRQILEKAREKQVQPLPASTTGWPRPAHADPSTQWWRNLVVPLLYLALALFSLRLVFGDDPIASHDLAPAYKLEQLYRAFGFPWDHWSNLGIPNYFMGNILYNLPLILLAGITDSTVFAHKLFLCLILAAAGYGFYLVFKALIPSPESKIAVFLAGLGYMFNPWSLDRFLYGHNTILLGFALLPYVFLFYLKSLKRVKTRYFLAGGLLSAILLLTNLHMAYFSFILIFFYGVFDVLSTGGEFRGRLKTQAFSIISFLGLTVAFSFPILYHIHKIDIPLYVVRGEETAYYASNPASISPTALLYLLAGSVLVGWGTIRLIREKQTPLFVFPLVCGIGVFLSFSNQWPIEPLYRFLFQYMPGFFIFVEANRFLFFPALAVSFFLGYLMNTSRLISTDFLHTTPVKPRLTAFKKLRTGNLPVILLLFLMVSAMWPFFTGDLGGSLQSVAIPDPYKELDAWLRSQEGDFRVAFLPPACWATEYNWTDTEFIDPIAALPAQPTLELKSERDVTLASSFLRWVYTSIYTNKTMYWGKLFGLMGVKYVIVRRDADLPQDRGDLRQFDLETTLTILNNSRDLVLLKEIGPLLIYENPYYLPHLFTAEDLSLVAGDRRTLITLSYLPDFFFGEQPIVFLDNQVNSSSILPHTGSVVLEGDRYWDLMLYLADEAVVIEPWNHVQPSVNDKVQWIRGDFSWYYYEGEAHTAPDNYIFTTGSNYISLPFTLQEPGLYTVLVQAYETSNPEFKGMNVRIGDDAEEVFLHSPSTRFESAFRWIPVGTYELDAGPHAFVATSLGGAAAISKVAVIPNATLTQTEQDVHTLMREANLSVTHVFEDYSWNADFAGEVPVSPSATFSNGHAIAPSQEGMTADFHVFKPGEYVPLVRVVNAGPNTSVLTISIDGVSTPLEIPPGFPVEYYALNPVRLDTGRHHIQVVTPENTSPCLVDHLLLRYADSNSAVEWAATPSTGSPVKEKTRILQLGLILDAGFNETHINRLTSFIDGLPAFTHYNFIIEEWDILNNASFLDYLKSKGELIPMFAYEQTGTLSARRAKADVDVHTFREKVGYLPNGSFMFQPDTYLANYLGETYGMDYVHGYCFDQWLIDWMSMRGAWQAPYYGSPTNIYVPAATSGGIIVLPHVTWDWLARFTGDHHYTTHPFTVHQIFEDWPHTRAYIGTLINRTLDKLEPYGYAKTEFEFRFAADQQYLDDISVLYQALIARADVTHMTDSELVSWLASTHPSTPRYTITYTSPVDNRTIEWLYSNQYRIARVDGRVTSFINYTQQGSDPYLNRVAVIDFQEAWSTNNSVNTSLSFEIDALTGGAWNPPPHGSGVLFTGPLSAFPHWYHQVTGVQPMDRVQRSRSLYEVHAEEGLLIFLEANTKYWRLIGETGAAAPLPVFGFANAYPLTGPSNPGSYRLEYQGLSHLMEGITISLCLTAVLLAAIAGLIRYRLRIGQS